MIPIRDTIRSRTFPVINLLIILANALVFIYELSLSPAQLTRLINTFGLVPAHIHFNDPVTLVPFITHMFLHGGWIHILGNMWFLFIFGDNVEDRLGSLRYLVFYIVGGFVAAGLQYFVSPTSQVAAIGASGAIAAVMGAYIILYPTARVVTLIPVFIFPWFVQIPSWIYIGIWFVIQLYSGLLSLSTAGGVSMGGVAWFAHIGGFIFGLLLARPLSYRQPDQYWNPGDHP